MADVLKLVIGPYGALVGAVIIIVFLWRELKQSQAVNTRQQDLFEEALKVIRDDLVPLVKDTVRRR